MCEVVGRHNNNNLGISIFKWEQNLLSVQEMFNKVAGRGRPDQTARKQSNLDLHCPGFLSKYLHINIYQRKLCK